MASDDSDDSAEFARRMWRQGRCVVCGSDKVMRNRKQHAECLACERAKDSRSCGADYGPGHLSQHHEYATRLGYSAISAASPEKETDDE